MQLILGMFTFMLASSLVMIAYVSIRDFKHKKLHAAAEIADAATAAFEEVQPAETTLTEYPDLRQKTA